jgi:hypothetical protein
VTDTNRLIGPTQMCVQQMVNNSGK